MVHVCMSGGSHTPAHYHKLPLGCTGSESLPYIHGENSAGTVEDGGQRGHEGSDHHRHHQTSQPWEGKPTETDIREMYACMRSRRQDREQSLTCRQQVHHQSDISGICAAHWVSTNLFTDLRVCTRHIIYIISSKHI